MSHRTTKSTIRCATSEDSDQTAHSRSLIRVFADRVCLLQPPGCPKRDKREPLPYWADAQAGLIMCLLQKSYCRFCRALVHISQLTMIEKRETKALVNVHECADIDGVSLVAYAIRNPLFRFGTDNTPSRKHTYINLTPLNRTFI